jgi:peroxiredoxin
MATAYELLGITVDATRAELDAAYHAQRAAYDPARVADLGADFVRLANQRRAELATAYHDLRAALAAPRTLALEHERRRDRETLGAVVLFVAIALLIPLLREIAVPVRVVEATGANATALQSRPAPDFRLPTLDGREISLAEYQGKVVLINLWATWCPSCVRETPRLVRLAERYQADGLVVLGVNTTFQDDREKITSFVRDYNISYPVLLDTQDTFRQGYTALLLPTSYLIDRDGKIIQVRVGEIDETQFEARVRELLGVGRIPTSATGG